MFDWTRGSGLTSSGSTGPTNDHTYSTTTGKYSQFSITQSSADQSFHFEFGPMVMNIIFQLECTQGLTQDPWFLQAYSEDSGQSSLQSGKPGTI